MTLRVVVLLVVLALVLRRLFPGRRLPWRVPVVVGVAVVLVRTAAWLLSRP